MLLRYMLIGMAIGVVTELVARLLRLWIYQQSQTAVLNVLLMFGFVMGGLASRVRPLGLPVVIGLAFGIGLLYEIINLRVFKWWSFPNERLGFIRGHAAIVVLLSLLWAGVPVAILEAHAMWPRGGRSAVSGEARLERLTQREQQLMQKLEGLQERLRIVESQLEEVRVLKQALLGRRAVRRPGPQDPAPARTP